SVSAPSTTERLAALPALAEIPRAQLQWLADHGVVRRLEDGSEIRGREDQPLGLFVLISGRFSVRMDQGGVTREMREVMPGRISGYLPYSRITAPRGYLVADGPVEFLEIRRDDVRAMTRECYEFTASCVHEMLDRVRVFKADDKEQEKMAALGRLSAGLAHELNNPASAVARAADALDRAREDLAAAARALGAAGLDGGAARPDGETTSPEDGTRELQEGTRDPKGVTRGTDAAAGEAFELLEAAVGEGAGRPLSVLERADLEDEIAEWLDARDMDGDLAYPLAEHGLTVTDLHGAARTLDARQLDAALRYLSADANVRDLTASIASAATRIHALVSAVKKHTHMDRAPAVEPIALRAHLEDTLALMGSKASRKGVALDLRVEAGEPTVDGTVVDLNQVWMHLVDNAIDAAPESGRVSVEMARDDDVVVVRVVDDGPGIPAEDRERVFEPFFTTKEVGQGSGLGLDIVRTVVAKHRGAVDVSSVPGRTEFRVTLPVSRTAP
ncbi:MAG: ATP-binding protein, partial [Longimicrobiales bacterium]|nr:ATP-binding protein [Longimicrobiales bacterium]